jgi:hypothetical protein
LGKQQEKHQQSKCMLLGAPVEEQIGGQNVYKRRYSEVEYVTVKAKYFIMN